MSTLSSTGTLEAQAGLTDAFAGPEPRSSRSVKAGAGPSPAQRQRELEQVYDMHVEQIYRFVYFKVGNREDAEDITSRVFVKAAHSLDVTQEQKVILAWLYQVARTTVTDHWRDFYKGPVTSLDKMEEENPVHLAAKPVSFDDPDEWEPDKAADKARKILDLLPENYRSVLQLRFLKGCSLKETATALGITEGNAKVIQHRALQKALKLGENMV